MEVDEKSGRCVRLRHGRLKRILLPSVRHMELSPSPEYLELLARLPLRRRGLSQAGSDTTTRAKVLRQLASIAEPALVPHLVMFGLIADSGERLQANTIVGSILDALDIRGLLDFDQCLRDRMRRSVVQCAEWTTLKARNLGALRSSEKNSVALIGAVSFHGSGYVREAAVRLLDEVESGAEVRFLLIRLNDWVPAVRSAAQHAIQRRLKPGYAHVFAQNIELIDRLLHWERVDHTQLLRWIVEYLRGPDGIHAVEVALDSANVRQRRLLYGLLLTPDRESVALLIRRALSDRDPVCRLQGIRLVSGHLFGEALRDVLHSALRDSFAAVRLVAARILAGSGTEPDATIVALLMDPSAAVRAVARYRLRQAGWTDFVSHYSGQLEDASYLGTCVALKAISEVGDARSAVLVQPYASAGDSKVAAAAVRTLGILDGDSYVEVFLTALRTGGPALMREAARALAGHIRLLDLHALWSYNVEMPWGPTRRRILVILFGAPKWDALSYMLKSLCDPHDEVEALAREHLDRWLVRFNRTSAPLSDALREQLQGQLYDVRMSLPPSLVRQLEFILR